MAWAGKVDEFSPWSFVLNPSIDYHHDFEVMSGRRYIRTASWSITGHGQQPCSQSVGSIRLWAFNNASSPS
jgi:hypothetical protein